MFNVGFGELTFIMVVALLVLGPRKLPELARGIGKFMREFRRQSEDIRQTVEREFYRMDRELEDALPKFDPPEGTRSMPPLHQAPPLPEDGAAPDADAGEGAPPHTPLSSEALAPTLATAPVTSGPAAKPEAPAATGTDGAVTSGKDAVDA